MGEEDQVAVTQSSGMMKTVLCAVAIIAVVFAILFGLSLRQIFVSVKGMCNTATQQFPGDNVEALIALVESDSVPFREKNRAIWALGQIGDKRALPLLRSLKTGQIQPKPYDSSRYIVQYSVDKAIKQIEGKLSLTRWMYRWL